MATVLSGKIALSLNTTLTKALPLSVTGRAELDHRIDAVITSGTGAGKATKRYTKAGSLSSGAEDSIDLAGALTDEFGETITFTKIKAIIFKNLTTNSRLRFGGGTSGAGTNAFDTWILSQAGGGAGDGSEGLIIKSGAGSGFAIWAADADGYAVTAGTGDLLTIKELDSHAATYELTIIGEAS